MEGIPLNIGYLAAYVREHATCLVEARLFAQAEKLESALAGEPPDMLAVSNYIWDYRLKQF